MFEQIMMTALPFIGAAAQIQGGREANAANAQQSQAQMDFQERMSSTAHQRQVQDLKSAGLNPILSANAGASSPSGAQATMQNTMEGVAGSAAEMASLAMNFKKQRSEINLLDSQTKKANMETAVMSKGVPAAEITNEMYKEIVRPLINKVKEIRNSNPKAPDFGSPQNNPSMDEALKRVREKSMNYRIGKP